MDKKTLEDAGVEDGKLFTLMKKYYDMVEDED